MRILAALALLAALVAPAGVSTAPAATTELLVTAPVGPYESPPFRCRFARYAEGETPPLSETGRDPLCVEYQKRDITLTNGGAVGFVLAEPARFAVAAPACRYWQIDHWSVQVGPDDDAVLRWDGSYWFDKGAMTAAAAFRRFTLAGEPVSARRAADAVRPVSPALAGAIETYGVSGGFGMGLAPVADASCTRLP